MTFLFSQVFVQAVDGGGRRSVAIGEITINVIRNQGPPVFVDYVVFPREYRLPYTTTVDYTINTPAAFVIAVSAIDNDNFNTVRYRLRTDSFTDRYFDIDSITGQISLQLNLTSPEVLNRTQFNVSCLIQFYRPLIVISISLH